MISGASRRFQFGRRLKDLQLNGHNNPGMTQEGNDFMLREIFSWSDFSKFSGLNFSLSGGRGWLIPKESMGNLKWVLIIQSTHLIS